jgi:hypothetical protein
MIRSRMARLFVSSDSTPTSVRSLRPRLVVWMQAIVAELEHDLDRTAKRHHPWRGKPEPAAAPKQRVAAMASKLARAREVRDYDR